MILDSIKNAELYYSVSPRLKKAFEYIQSTDLEALAEGRYEIEGSDIFVNIVERDLKTTEEAKLEVHNLYADIQIVVSGDDEGFGYIERCKLQEPAGEFNTEKDIQFFKDAPQTIYYIRPGQFTLLLPEDAHAPLIGSGRVKKAVVKVLL
ncbi:MAG: YhcH/YjgK/YiaL family protein [Rikenellaceae bacterium]